MRFMVRSFILCLCFSLFSTGAAAAPADSRGVYWTEFDRVRSASLNGSNPQTLTSAILTSPVALTLEPASAKLYWVDATAREISRSNLDGSDIEFVFKPAPLPGGGGLRDVQIDIAAGQLYIVDIGYNRIQRADLDGSNVVTLVRTPGGNTARLALDLPAGKMYWTNHGEFGSGEGIFRANLDGTGVEQLPIPGLAEPWGIALDTAAAKVYWTDSGSGTINRANLDGSGAETLLSGLSAPWELELDLANGRIFWADILANKIQSANLDGTGLTDLVDTGLVDPSGVAYDPQQDVLYFSDGDGSRIYQVKPDGSDLAVLIDAGVSFPFQVAVDALRDTVYWSEGSGNIWRANLDGSSAQVLIEGLGMVTDIELDPLRGYLYWGGVGGIYRAGLDGSGQRLLTPGFDVFGIGLDNANGKIYWTETSPNRAVVKRANLNGSNQEELYSEVGFSAFAGDIAVDGRGGRIYFSNILSILSADLDGQNVSTVVPGLQVPIGVDLDLRRGRVYWAESGRGRIARADLDGTNVTPVVLLAPFAIGLDVQPLP